MKKTFENSVLITFCDSGTSKLNSFSKNLLWLKILEKLKIYTEKYLFAKRKITKK
jgi:hypothetical protein